MAFNQGHKKKGGRRKGVKNKKTLIIDTFAKTITEGGMEKFQRELMKLKGKTFVTSFLDLFEYVQPKLQRLKVDINLEDLSDADLDRIIDREKQKANIKANG